MHQAYWALLQLHSKQIFVSRWVIVCKQLNNHCGYQYASRLQGSSACLVSVALLSRKAGCKPPSQYVFLETLQVHVMKWVQPLWNQVLGVYAMGPALRYLQPHSRDGQASENQRRSLQALIRSPRLARGCTQGPPFPRLSRFSNQTTSCPPCSRHCSVSTPPNGAVSAVEGLSSKQKDGSHAVRRCDAQNQEANLCQRSKASPEHDRTAAGTAERS